MKEVYLLVAVILFVVYIFATNDDPYIPIAKREKKIGSKRKIINWYSWRGPMFIEDFTNSDFEGSDRSCAYKSDKNLNFTCGEEYPGIIGTGDQVCNVDKCHKHQKYNQDFLECSEIAMFKSRTPPSTLTSADSWDNDYHNDTHRMRPPNPITGDLGNFKQVTNNNLDAPNQIKCVNKGRWDGDTCSPEHLVSKVCYKAQLDKCMRNRGHTIY